MPSPPAPDAAAVAREIVGRWQTIRPISTEHATPGALDDLVDLIAAALTRTTAEALERAIRVIVAELRALAEEPRDG